MTILIDHLPNGPDPEEIELAAREGRTIPIRSVSAYYRRQDDGLDGQRAWEALRLVLGALDSEEEAGS